MRYTKRCEPQGALFLNFLFIFNERYAVTFLTLCIVHAKICITIIVFFLKKKKNNLFYFTNELRQLNQKGYISLYNMGYKPSHEKKKKK